MRATEGGRETPTGMLASGEPCCGVAPGAACALVAARSWAVRRSTSACSASERSRAALSSTSRRCTLRAIKDRARSQTH